MSTPYRQHMPDGTPPTSPLATLLREGLAFSLILAGLVGLIVAGFAWDWRAGVALISTTAIAGGFTLARDR